MEDLSIDYQPTEGSVRAALLSGFGFWKMAGWMAFAFSVIMALIQASSVDWMSPMSILSWCVLCVSAGLGWGLAMSLLFRLVLIPLAARNTFRKNRVFFGPSTLTVSDAGLSFKTANASAAFKWGDMRGYRMSKGVLVLQSGTARFAVPTQQTPSTDLEALRSILERHLSKPAAVWRFQ